MLSLDFIEIRYIMRYWKWITPLNLYIFQHIIHDVFFFSNLQRTFNNFTTSGQVFNQKLEDIVKRRPIFWILSPAIWKQHIQSIWCIIIENRTKTLINLLRKEVRRSIKVFIWYSQLNKLINDYSNTWSEFPIFKQFRCKIRSIVLFII